LQFGNTRMDRGDTQSVILSTRFLFVFKYGTESLEAQVHFLMTSTVARDESQID